MLEQVLRCEPSTYQPKCVGEGECGGGRMSGGGECLGKGLCVGMKGENVERGG